MFRKEDASDTSQFVALTRSVVDDDDEKIRGEADASDNESWIKFELLKTVL